jgi:hypothetical protein
VAWSKNREQSRLARAGCITCAASCGECLSRPPPKSHSVNNIRTTQAAPNRPLCVDRDGVRKYNLADIGSERRNGYAWYVASPQVLVTRDDPAWKKKLPRP